MKSQAKIFSLCASDYSKYRPTYPSEAIRTIFNELKLHPGDRVCDLAAGSGTLSLLMAAQGGDVIAVEPLREMIAVGVAQAAQTGLPVQFCQGTAEYIPLMDRSVKAVTCGQAFHWLDAELALKEIHRILEDSGGVALIWNFRDWEHSDWLHRFESLIMEYNPNYHPDFQRKAWGNIIAESGLFEPARYVEYFHDRQLGKREIMGLIRTLSYVRILPDSRRSRLEKAIDALLADQLKLEGKRKLPVRLRTELYLTTKHCCAI